MAWLWSGVEGVCVATVPKCVACLCGEDDTRERGSGVRVEAVCVCVGVARVWESGTCVCERAVYMRGWMCEATARAGGWYARESERGVCVRGWHV